MKTWEKVGVGIVVLLVIYYIYTNYVSVPVASPVATTNGATGDSELPSGGGSYGYTTPTTSGGMTSFGTGPSVATTPLPLPSPQLADAGRTALSIAGQGPVQGKTASGQAFSFSVDANGMTHFGPAAPTTIPVVVPISTTEHPASAQIHPLLNGSRH